MAARVRVELTRPQIDALRVAALVILSAAEPPDFWGMTGHEVKALGRAYDALQAASLARWPDPS